MNELLYNVNPKRCAKCGAIMPYIRRNNTFCGRSCANGRIHTQTTKDRIATTLMARPKKAKPRKKVKLNKIIGEFSKISFCTRCSRVMKFTMNRMCQDCSTYSAAYRARCAFKFNPYHYPDKFDLNLLEELGWYSPTGKSRKEANLKGVSRDHLYSISDGIKNKIDPEILSHPANCKLIAHADNMKKGKKSEITIEELHSRISEWVR